MQMYGYWIREQMVVPVIELSYLDADGDLNKCAVRFYENALAR